MNALGQVFRTDAAFPGGGSHPGSWTVDDVPSFYLKILNWFKIQRQEGSTMKGLTLLFLSHSDHLLEATMVAGFF